MADSKIDWTDKVWNPTTGCTMGCSYCYAEKMAHRLQRMGQAKYVAGFTPTCHPGELEKPLHWKKPSRIFVNSMGDLFDPAIPFSFIDQVMAVISLRPQHTFQILTKQPARMSEYFAGLTRNPTYDTLPNLWLGVSAENQAAADSRIPLLLATPAAIRFVSLEPMRDTVYLDKFLGVEPYWFNPDKSPREWRSTFDPKQTLDWVIMGGETGPAAAPLNVFAALDILKQIQAAGIPLYFKGWGEWVCNFPDQRTVEARELRKSAGFWFRNEHRVGPVSYTKLGKQLSGSLLDGQEWRQFPC